MEQHESITPWGFEFPNILTMKLKVDNKSKESPNTNSKNGIYLIEITLLYPSNSFNQKNSDKPFL